jgi:hypothetical protein
MILDFDIKLLNNVYIDGIDTRDYPDFVDAFIESADYGDRELTEKECEWVTDNYPSVVNELVFEQLL